MERKSLKLVSLNCNGLINRKTNKRDRIFTFLQSLNYDVVFLQETHINDEREREIFKRAWTGMSFINLGNFHSSGAAILFRKGLEVDPINIINGPDGRYIIIECTINKEPTTLINVYLPNLAKARDQMVESLENILNGKPPIIIGGDFNFIEDNKLDQINANNKRGASTRTVFKMFRYNLNLFDAFRHLHPTSVDVTHVTHGCKPACAYLLACACI
jgi:exonuclease III